MSATFFVNTLRKCNIFIDIPCDTSDTSSSVTITCLEPAKSFRQLDSLFRIQRAHIDEFLTSMNSFFDIPPVLVSILSPLDGQGQHGHLAVDKLNSMYGQTDTLLKLLLRIEPLQDPIIEVLLGKMLLLVSEHEGSSEQERLATQIFNHIRWCEYLFSPEFVVKTCLESLPVLPSSLQIEIIISIPAILTASSLSKELLDELLGLAQGSPALLPCILEAIGNLCLSYGSEGYKNVVSFAIDELNSADIALLPVLTRFLLEAAGPDTVEYIWRETRSRLVQFIETASPGSDDCSDRCREWMDFQSLLMSLLRSAFIASSSRATLFQAMMATISVQEGEAAGIDGGAEELSVLDMWILLALADSPQYKTKIHTCLIKQIEQGRLAALLVHQSLLHYPIVSAAIFPAALSCAQSLLTYHRVGKQSSLSHAHSMGVWIYLALYNSLPAGSRRQEVLVALVGHVTSPVQREVDSGLCVLSSLANAEHVTALLEIRRRCNVSPPPCGDLGVPSASSSSSLRVFLPFIKSLLEDVHMLKEHQQRVLFRIIFQCAMANPDLFSLRSEVFRDSSGSSGSSRVGDSTCAREAHHVQPAPIDDVMILLKKFSSSMDTAVRKVGILGHTAHLMEEALLQTVLAPLRSGEGQQGGSDDNDDDIPRKPDQSGAKLPYIQRLETLLAMTARDTEGHVFFLEELTTQIELYAEVLKDTALIQFLRYDVEDQLFQYIGGLDLDLEEEEEDNAEGGQGTSRTQKRKETARDRYIKQQNCRLHCMQSSLLFDINRPELSTAYAKIYPTVVLDVRRRRNLLQQSNFSGPGSGQSLREGFTPPGQFLCPLLEPILHLVTACERCMDGNLTELGLLMGIPLELPREDIMDIAEDYNDTDREIICSSLFYGVVWLRSLLSVFTHMDQLPPEQYHKLVLRMNQLVEMEDALLEHIQRFPQYLEIVAPDSYSTVGKYNVHTGKKVASVSALEKASGPATSKKSSSKRGKRGTEATISGDVERLIMEELREFVELSLLRPFSHHVSCILGVGVEPLVYTPDALALGNTQATQASVLQRGLSGVVAGGDGCGSVSVQQEVTQLSDGAIVKLLKSTVQWCSSSDRDSGSIGGYLEGGVSLVSKVRLLHNHGVFCSLFTLVNRIQRSIGGGRGGDCVILEGSSKSIGMESESSVLGNSELPVPSEMYLKSTSKKLVQEEQFDILEQVVCLYGELLSNKHMQEDVLAVGKSYDSSTTDSFDIPLLIQISNALAADGSVPDSCSSLQEVATCVERALRAVFDMLRSLALSLLRHRTSRSTAAASDSGHHTGEGESDIDPNIEFEDVDTEDTSILFKKKSGMGEAARGKVLTSRNDIYMGFVVQICHCLDKLLDLGSRLLLAQPEAGLFSTTLGTLLLPSGLPMQLAELCESLLQYDWANSRLRKVTGGSDCSEYTYSCKDVSLFVQLMLKYSSNPLEKVQFMVNDLFVEELTLMSRSDCSDTFPTLTISSCVHYYLPLLQALAVLWETVQKKKKGQEQGQEQGQEEGMEEGEGMQSLVVLVDCFSSLIMLTKYEGNPHTKAGAGINRRAVLLIALREGRMFMETFMRTSKNLHGLFSEHRDTVLRMLGRLQKATRQLQSLALYGKRNRDKMLSQEGPKLKRVLEQLIYRMKDMTQECEGAGMVYVGNLKSRDITGKEILEEESESQSDSDSDSESGGEEAAEEVVEEEEASEDNDEPRDFLEVQVKQESGGYEEKCCSGEASHKRPFTSSPDCASSGTKESPHAPSALSQLFTECSQVPLGTKRTRRHQVISSDSE